MKKIAVIDLGSNSVRMSIFDKSGNTLAAFRNTVRLSEGMTEDMCLKAEPQMRTVMMLKKYRGLMDAEGITAYRAVATAAVRKAKNRGEFLALVRDIAGIEIEVIDGKTEAALDSLAISKHLNIEGGIICDIGGGSTELIAISSADDTPMVSIPHGSRGLCEKFFSGGETPESIEKAQIFSDNLIAEQNWLSEYRGKTLVGIGGTLRALAKLDLGDTTQAPIQSHQMSAPHLLELIAEIERSTPDERAEMPGIGRDRADIILGGVILVKSVLKTLQPSEITVADVGVREGVFWDYIAKNE